MSRPASCSTSKCWTTSKGIERHGNLIDKGYVYKLFKNVVYIGMAGYKGQNYPGEHQGIISQELWDQVQEHLQNGDSKQKGPKADRAGRASRSNPTTPGLRRQPSYGGRSNIE